MMANHSSALAEQALKLFGVLYDVEREIKDLPADDRLRIRQIKTRPAADLLHAWLTANRRKVPDATATAKAMDYSAQALDSTDAPHRRCRLEHRQQPPGEPDPTD